MIVHGYLHVMIDLILVNEDTGVFGNEISIQGDISCCTKREEMRELHQKSWHNLKVSLYKTFCLTSEVWWKGRRKRDEILRIWMPPWKASWAYLKTWAVWLCRCGHLQEEKDKTLDPVDINTELSLKGFHNMQTLRVWWGTKQRGALRCSCWT